MSKRKLKRANQEGSIHQRKSGSWRAQITIDGHRISFSGGSYAECQAWVRKMLGRVDKGLSYEDLTLTMSEYLQDWLAAAKVSVRSKTHEQYEQICRDYLVPNFGHVILRELSSGHVQHVYSKYLEQGMSIRSVRMVHSVLNRALNYAVELNIIERNPASIVKLPKPKRSEMKYYDESQTQKFLMIAEFEQDRYLALWKLALTTGMRQGELLGLQWNDLDWQRKTIHVRRQLKRVRGGGFQFSEPKTKAGIRSILLGDETIRLLHKHEDVLQLERIKAGDLWKESNLIFPSTVGTPTQPDKIIKRFKRLAEKAGLPKIRFHDLRHTAASLMLNSGIPVIVVSRRLGHSKASVTLDVYGHLIPSMQEQVAEIMDRITTPIAIEIPF